MTTEALLKTAQNLPLHDPARVALLDAFVQLNGHKQALQYANAALLASQTDRANLLCACARIAYGVGSASDYSATARAAIAGLGDMAAESIDACKPT
jgi:hypothetical protein